MEEYDFCWQSADREHTFVRVLDSGLAIWTDLELAHGGPADAGSLTFSELHARGMPVSVPEELRPALFERIAETERRCRPLGEEVRKWNEEAIRRALGGGGHGARRDLHGNTALHAAAKAPWPQLVAQLLAAGAEVEAKSSNEARRPLHEAAAVGALDVIATLLGHGADVAAANADGSTPLHAVFERFPSADRSDVVRALLAVGADPEARDRWDRSPVQLAHGCQQSGAVKALISAGADGK